MTVYDRDILDAIRYIGRELRETKKELAEIKKVLQAEKAPAKIIISKDGVATIGKGIMPDLERYLEAKEEKEE